MRVTRPSSQFPPQADTLRLWQEYRASGDSKLRDRLVLAFAPLVKSLAWGKKRALPAHFPVDELISSGQEALIRSLDRYDPEKGGTLEWFLWRRIGSAMIDELRSQDSASRAMRVTERTVSDARRDFCASHRRQPSAKEISAATGITEARLHVHRRDLCAIGSVGSLNAPVGEDEHGAERGDLLVAGDGDPEAVAFATADSDALSAALATLSDRERTVIGLRYFHEMTLGDVGELVGLSESRVCQINNRAKGQLRQQLAGGILAPAI
jgi:RNA polymerase sigma factor for flagellar operon FliA